jgi:hypothetical protein
MADTPFVLRYKIGEITRPKAGCIVAFKSKGQARSWAEVSTMKVFKCKARISERKPGTYPNAYMKLTCFHKGLKTEVKITDFLKTIWKNPGRKIAWPRGTVFCSSILPIEEVK